MGGPTAGGPEAPICDSTGGILSTSSPLFVVMRAAVLALAFVLTPTTFAQTDAAPADTTATPAVAQAERRALVRDSDAETRALILNVFVPGLGHLQAGDTGPGVALLGLGVALPVGTALATGVSSFQCSTGAGCDDLDSNTALFLTAATVGLGAWIYGMVDADNAVRRVQDRRLAAAPTVVSSGAGVAPGLALRVEL